MKPRIRYQFNFYWCTADGLFSAGHSIEESYTRFEAFKKAMA